jgi:hypothetical protein
VLGRSSGCTLQPLHVENEGHRAVIDEGDLPALVQAIGTQDGGYAQSLGGIPILSDANIGTTYWAGTNQDHVYLVAKEDFILMEGPVMVRVDEASQSGTGVIRLSLFAFSAFLSNRYPDSLCIVSGTGLTTPVFG